MIKFTDKRGMETFLSLRRYLDSAVEAAMVLELLQNAVEVFGVEFTFNTMVEEGTDVFSAVEAATLGKVTQETLFLALFLEVKLN